ncbi:MAG: hypothetical protein WCD35_19190 [Mycobacteriales bacterium]
MLRRWPVLAPEPERVALQLRERDEATTAALQAYLATRPGPSRVVDLRL